MRSLEVKKVSRFIYNGNGTVTDTKTGLMWAAKDNGYDISLDDAKSYCKNYNAGGYTDWRMPTQGELAGLYDADKNYRATQRDYDVHLTQLIALSTCCLWTSDTSTIGAAYFPFRLGLRLWFLQSTVKGLRALPVRSAK